MTNTTPTEAAHVTQLAIKHALSGERGPVAVVYQSNCFLGGAIDPEQRPYLYSTNAYLPSSTPAAPFNVQAAAKAMAAAKQPVIIAGNGVRISKAYRELALIRCARRWCRSTLSRKMRAGRFPWIMW
jgi:acetolactate synthase-1/2/3 large subunit